jgi:hypothetical protein
MPGKHRKTRARSNTQNVSAKRMPAGGPTRFRRLIAVDRNGIPKPRASVVLKSLRYGFQPTMSFTSGDTVISLRFHSRRAIWFDRFFLRLDASDLSLRNGQGDSTLLRFNHKRAVLKTCSHIGQCVLERSRQGEEGVRTNAVTLVYAPLRPLRRQGPVWSPIETARSFTGVPVCRNMTARAAARLTGTFHIRDVTSGLTPIRVLQPSTM